MYYEFDEHKKSDTVKWIITFTAIILLVASVVALGANAFGFNFGGDAIVEPDNTDTENNGTENEGGTEPIEPIEPNNPDDENIETIQIENSDIVTLSVKRLAGETATYGDDGTIAVYAYITPVDAAYGELDWYLEWADENCDYAQNYVSPYEYIDLEKNNAEKVVYLTVVQPFTEQIVLNVLPSYNPAAKAACYIDYGQKLAPMGSQYLNMTDSSFFPYGRVYSDFPLTIGSLQWGSTADMVGNWDYNGKITQNTQYESEYSVENQEEHVTFTVSVQQYFYNILVEKGIATEYTSYEFEADELTVANVLNSLCAGTLIPLDGSEANYDLINTFNDVCEEADECVAFTITAHVESSYDSDAFIYYICFGTEQVDMPVEIMVSDTNLVV